LTRSDQCGLEGALVADFVDDRAKDALPEGPVPAELFVLLVHGLLEASAEEDQAAGAVDDGLVDHEAFFVEGGHAEGALLLDHAAPGDLQGHPVRLLVLARPRASGLV
jgi:hypothetical protein